MIKLPNFFTAWVSDLVKFPEKGLGTMAAIWPSSERVNTAINGGINHSFILEYFLWKISFDDK
jgi:hypothetical protein